MVAASIVVICGVKKALHIKTGEEPEVEAVGALLFDTGIADAVFHGLAMRRRRD